MFIFILTSSSFLLYFVVCLAFIQITWIAGAYSISPGTNLIAEGITDALSKGITDIFLEPGIHLVTDWVIITEEVTISGAGRGTTFVQRCGFLIKGKKGKKCTLMDITVQKTGGSGLYEDGESYGLYGQSGMSFDCLRMHFDQCGGYGVHAWKTKGRLTNCQITQCESSGVCSYGKSTIEIAGEETMIEKNNTNGDDDSYGLEAYHHNASFIHILSPLTKESISKNNQNGNYGGDGTIKVVTSFITGAAVSFAPPSSVGETNKAPSSVRI